MEGVDQNPLIKHSFCVFALLHPKTCIFREKNGSVRKMFLIPISLITFLDLSLAICVNVLMIFKEFCEFLKLSLRNDNDSLLEIREKYNHFFFSKLLFENPAKRKHCMLRCIILHTNDVIQCSSLKQLWYDIILQHSCIARGCYRPC